MKLTPPEQPTKKLDQQFSFIITLLKGVGQIMLQESVFTGLLFLAGIFYGSLSMGFAALLAVFIGTITAKILGFNKTETAQGIYGFSPALVGVALLFYFESNLIVWLSVIVGSVLAAIVQHGFSVKKIPVFTFPFIVVTWGLIYVLRNSFGVPAAEFLNSTAVLTPDFAFALRGFGQVIFQGSTFAGAAFFIGVFVCSPIRALYGLAAALIAGILAGLYNAPADGIMQGLFSYNAVLCAIVFAGNKAIDGVWTFIAVALSLVVSFVMNAYNFTPLTFPFVVGTWIVLVLQKSTKGFFLDGKPAINE
ncbi:urea transporter [Flavobacterium sp. FlaQc-57]|uniref:urea transporter n=1 Tax=Flavobacterium sp. FlaQc-57 TaxID=3374186 RepID=UPI0037567563